MTETLFYDCSPRPFFVLSGMPSYRERIGRLDVIEFRRRSKVRSYGLRIESQVSTTEEATICHAEALQLACDLKSDVHEFCSGDIEIFGIRQNVEIELHTWICPAATWILEKNGNTLR